MNNFIMLLAEIIKSGFVEGCCLCKICRSMIVTRFSILIKIESNGHEKDDNDYG